MHTRSQVLKREQPVSYPVSSVRLPGGEQGRIEWNYTIFLVGPLGCCTSTVAAQEAGLPLCHEQHPTPAFHGTSPFVPPHPSTAAHSLLKIQLLPTALWSAGGPGRRGAAALQARL